MRGVPLLCELYPGICLTTEEKAWKTLNQGSRRLPAGKMKIHNRTIRIHRHYNKNRHNNKNYFVVLSRGRMLRVFEKWDFDPKGSYRRIEYIA